MKYSSDSIRKYLEKARAVKQLWQEVISRGESVKVCISDGNRKIGRVMNVSTSPILACGNCKECFHFCYDIKANLQYGNVLQARARNLALALYDRESFFDQIKEAIKRRKRNFYFRWHVAGDILDADYFRRMVEIAAENPACTFWTYTKMYGIVNSYIRHNGPLPNNLHVMFSDWEGMEMLNPYHMPTFSCKLESGNPSKPDGYFDSLYKCPGNCDVCKATGRGCVAGESAYADEH